MSAPVVTIRPSVINIKDAPRGWSSNPQYVYIGRPGRGLSGDFGNPFPISVTCSRAESLRRFEEDYLKPRLRTDPIFRAMVKALAGKILVCFCKPYDCHGDILANYCVNLNREVGAL